ncbi:MAG: hypothetical protein U0M50_10355 [Paramuribaculum sp.]
MLKSDFCLIAVTVTSSSQRVVSASDSFSDGEATAAQAVKAIMPAIILRFIYRSVIINLQKRRKDNALRPLLQTDAYDYFKH